MSLPTVQLNRKLKTWRNFTGARFHALQFYFQKLRTRIAKLLLRPAAYENPLNRYGKKSHRYKYFSKKSSQNLLEFSLLLFRKQSTRKIKKFFSKQLANCSLRRQIFTNLFRYFFFFFHFSHRNNDIYILNILHSRIWWTDDQQWRRSAGIPPLVNAASRRQLEVSSSGWKTDFKPGSSFETRR